MDLIVTNPLTIINYLGDYTQHPSLDLVILYKPIFKGRTLLRDSEMINLYYVYAHICILRLNVTLYIVYKT